MKPASLSLLLAALLLAPVSATAQTGRLPQGVTPVHYAISITPDAPNMRFSGRAEISVDVAAATDRITLNALDLKLDSVRLDGRETPKVEIDEAAQTASFVFARPVQPGRHTLAIDYRGKIYTSAAGLFALDYDDARGKQRMLATQFEPTDARRFAPMWDEPAYKATFALDATVPADQLAVSNMPVSKLGKAAKGQKRVHFATSPKMSTYLLFFAVGDLERVTTKVGDVEIGVVTRRGAGETGRYALDSAARLLPYYNDYFGTPYPLPKLDMIAGPGNSQFFGAMENWGAILYFERVLLLDPTLSGQFDRQLIFQVVAHEVAHQWFGDLVTMRWWNDLWLNEGFASWMESKATDHFNPDWHLWPQLVRDSRASALRLDARATTHSVVQQMETVEQIAQAFDEITYEKGQAIVRMIEASVGETAFRDGVRRYMQRYAYDNTVTDQLWEEAGAAAGRPVTQLAHDFTLQPGVPLVEVKRSRCINGETVLDVLQRRFATDASRDQKLEWGVPLMLKHPGDSATSLATVRGSDVQTVRIAGCGATLVNAGQTGYFRTLYDPASFDALRSSLLRADLIDQIGLLSDTYALGLAGEQPATDYLALAASLPASADAMLWEEVARGLSGYDHYLDGQPAQVQLRAFARARLQPVFARLGFDPRADDTPTMSLARTALIRALGHFDDAQVIAEARQRFAASQDDPSRLPPAIRQAVIDVVSTHADAATWDMLHRMAQGAGSPREKLSYYEALGNARDRALADRALALVITDEPPPTARPAILAHVAIAHPAQALDFAIGNAANVLENVEATSRGSYFAELTGTALDRAVGERLRSYATAALSAEARGDVDRAIAAIEERAAIREKQMPAVAQWLARAR